MQVDDSTKVVLAGPVEGVVQQIPGLRELLSLLIPELYLVDGDAHEVEAQVLQTLEIVFLDMQPAGLATLL